jgi:hypothetical protein
MPVRLPGLELEKGVDTLRQECARLQARNCELLRALSDGTAAADVLLACEQKYARLQAQNDELLKEAGIPRGASAGATAEDPAPSPPSPSGLKKLSAILQSSDAAVRACLAELGPAVDFEQASDEELGEMRQIRSHAAILAMEGIAIMIMYFGALRQSMLRRVHAATWRPREAGSLDAAADAVAPTIARLYLRSRLLLLLLPLLWLIGVACSFCVGFDRFERGSVEEWLACSAGALMLPVIVCIGASLNAKTVRSLLKEFQTLYVLVNVLAAVCLTLFLLREHPAKMVCFSLMLPALLLAGFLDAYVEGGRLLNSRIFFTSIIAAIITVLLLVSLKLGDFADYTFEVSTFAFVASSMVCSPLTTLLVFGSKNLCLSFYRPGSLVVLTSSVSCLLLDADTLAVLKAAYSLLGQTLGKRAANRTVARQLEKQRKSIVAAAGALTPERPRGPAAAAEIPAPTADSEHSDRAWEGGALSLNIVVPMISGQQREDAV